MADLTRPAARGQGIGEAQDASSMEDVTHRQTGNEQEERDDEVLARRHHHGHREGRAGQEDRGQFAPRARRIQRQRDEQCRQREVAELFIPET